MKPIPTTPPAAKTSGAIKEAFIEKRHDIVGGAANFMRVTLTCPSLRGSIGTESCLRDDLERIDATNYFIEMEGDEFITAIVMPGEDALIFADTATVLALDGADQADQANPADPADMSADQAAVHQATGMVSVQLGVSVELAFAQLR